MNGSEVALAALGILGGAVAVLTWLIRGLFSMNSKTLGELADSIKLNASASERIVTSLDKRDQEDKEFQSKLLARMDAQNAQLQRQNRLLDSINQTTVDTLKVVSEGSTPEPTEPN